MKRAGFTLVELLVVIAIISILTAIVVPNVANYIGKARMTKAEAEIRNVETALTKMLSDVNKKDFSQVFEVDQAVRDAVLAGTLSVEKVIDELYTPTFYALLRKGRTFNRDLRIDGGDLPTIDVPGLGTRPAIDIRPDILAKLGSSYMEMPKDPWGNLYRFYPGPWEHRFAPWAPVIFRCHVTLPGEDAVTGLPPLFIYNPEGKALKDAEIPGNPRPDYLDGYPAPKDLPVYIYSTGQDLVCNQPFYNLNFFLDVYTNPNGFPTGAIDPTYAGLSQRYKGGGDDINNWDNASGWASFYG